MIGTQCFFCLSSLNCSARVRGAEEISIVEQDLAKYLLKSFNPSKSMGPDGMHPRVPRELADVTVRHLSIKIKRLWS